MRKFLVAFILSITCFIYSQAQLFPGKNIVDTKWLKNEVSNLKWYMLRDTAKIEIGTIKTTVNVKKSTNKLYVVQEIMIKSQPGQWIDSAVVNMQDMRPVYHSSYNKQRNMVLRFKKDSVTGYYKATDGQLQVIKDRPAYDCFDSNFYPTLLRWLALKDKYTVDMPIYDYNGNTHGVLRASIKNTETVELDGKEVWKLTVTDGLSVGSTSYYYIDKQTRKLLKLEIDGPRKMLMVSVD